MIYYLNVTPVNTFTPITLYIFYHANITPFIEKIVILHIMINYYLSITLMIVVDVATCGGVSSCVRVAAILYQ